MLNILKLNMSAHQCYSSVSAVELKGVGGKHDQSSEDNQRSPAADLGLNLSRQFCVSFYCCMKMEW